MSNKDFCSSEISDLEIPIPGIAINVTKSDIYNIFIFDMVCSLGFEDILVYKKGNTNVFPDDSCLGGDVNEVNALFSRILN